MSLIQRLIRQYKIKINNKKSKANSELKKGDIIFIYYNFELNNQKNFTIKISEEFRKTLRKKIIFENNDFIIINKLRGYSIQRGSKVRTSLKDYYESLLGHPLYIVHRLDKDTSGILVIAKNLKTAKTFHDFFKNKKIIKLYLAIISPPPSKKEKYITSNIEKSSFSNVRKMTTSDIKGKFAETYMKILVKNSKYALALLYPITGRTHQLRVHMNYIGCSIIGDKKYKLNENFRDNENFLKLHSYVIKFPNQDFIKAPLPEHFINFMKENKLDINLEKIEKNFEKEFKYE